MRKFDTFTWIIIFFLVIGFISALINNFKDMIIPFIIFGLIIFFLRNPKSLNFLKKDNKQHQDDHQQRKNSFTVIDGKFKDVNKKK